MSGSLEMLLSNDDLGMVGVTVRARKSSTKITAIVVTIAVIMTAPHNQGCLRGFDMPPGGPEVVWVVAFRKVDRVEEMVSTATVGLGGTFGCGGWPITPTDKFTVAALLSRQSMA